MAAPAEHVRVSVAGRVADQLRDLIRDGAYPPGARLELGTARIARAEEIGA